MLISEKKKDFKITKITRDTDGHSIVRKGTLHQEDITYALTQGAKKYTKQLLQN